VSQLAFIEALQHLRTPPLTILMGAVTMLGDERIVVAGAGLLYLCVQRRLGLCALALFFVSAIVNDTVKTWAATARPFVVGAPQVVPLMQFTGGGWAFPSGHAQTVFALGTYLALSLRQRRWWLLAAAAFVLVPFSRMYLAMHWPVDVLGGAALGSLLGAGLYLLQPGGETPPPGRSHPRSRWGRRLACPPQGLADADLRTAPPSTDPPAEPRPWPWYVLAGLLALGLALGAAQPDGPTATVRAGAGLAALLLGYTALVEWSGGYEPTGTTRARLVRGLLGLVAVAATAAACELLLPHTMWKRLVAAALPVLVLVWAYPYLLRRLTRR